MSLKVESVASVDLPWPVHCCALAKNGAVFRGTVPLISEVKRRVILRVLNWLIQSFEFDCITGGVINRWFSEVFVLSTPEFKSAFNTNDSNCLRRFPRSNILFRYAIWSFFNSLKKKNKFIHIQIIRVPGNRGFPNTRRTSRTFKISMSTNLIRNDLA